ncbi:MAG: DUF1573 domain-containing protein [Desulfobacteraceae bacterium]|nr:DUF1573 domain-containing protein [Desulfobacteraceae bacterium]MBC2757620.1 DUF1573 domain-containing protein [Desulfobacteraceae bacterium]
MNIKKVNIIFVFIILMGLLLLPVYAEQETSPPPVSEPPVAPPAQPDTAATPSPESADSDPALIQQAVPLQSMAWPAAFIPEPEFEFEPVVDGAKIVHNFIIQNQGTAPLTISDIRTGCACAVPEYPRVIFPQQEGKITITIDTTGYGGRDFSRSIMISTNEPMNSMLKVIISGRINDFAHFDPKKIIILRGKAAEKIKLTVTITPDEKYPFTITNFELDEALKDVVKISLEKKDEKYVLTTENKMNTPGRYMGKIHLHTDSSFKPQINMIIRGIIE